MNCLVVAVVLSFLLTAGGENRVAAATCATLGLMRWSAKLNLFLGVRNYNQDWLPELALPTSTATPAVRG
jgi:putative photosynthetic complex assembly protein 2